MAAGCTAAAAPSGDPLAPYLWKSRIIVAFARSASDPRLARQSKLFRDMGAGGRERDLVLVEAVGAAPAAEVLRRRFDTGEPFAAMLIGKDGGEKLRSDQPVGEAELFPLIDSMPMRREEMSRKR